MGVRVLSVSRRLLSRGVPRFSLRRHPKPILGGLCLFLVVVALAGGAALTLHVPAAQAAPTFTIVDLGTLGGNYSRASAINDSGQVAGDSQTVLGDLHAFLWQNGSMQDLGTLPGLTAQSSAYAINNQGHVVGESNSSTLQHAFLYNGTSMTDLGGLTGSTITNAYGINNNDDVVGQSYGGTGAGGGWLLPHGGSFQTLAGLYAGGSGIPFAINDNGVITGQAGGGPGTCGIHAVSWSSGAITDLDGRAWGTSCSSSYPFSTGSDVNTSGVVAGGTFATGSPGQACWFAGTISSTISGTCGSDYLDVAQSQGPYSAHVIVNDNGVMVGSGTTQEFLQGYGFFDPILLDVGGTITDLSATLFSPAGWTGVQVADMNRSGQIVGRGTPPGGTQQHAFLLNPNASLDSGQALGGPGGSFGANPTDSEAEPVNTATGSYYTSVSDLRLGGIGVRFAMTRSYNSADQAVGPLGIGWTYSYNASLAVQPNGDVIARSGDGQHLYFTKQPNGSFTGASGGRSTLSSITGGYELVTHDQLHYRFDSQGRLTSLKDRNGEGLTFAYDVSGNMNAVTDSVGRIVTFGYNGSLLTDVTLPDGRNAHYGYTNGLLTSARDARGNTTQYTYDSGNRLATIVDPNLNTVVHNVYDPATGRVSDQYDGRNDHSTFGWDPAAQTSTFTDARGHQWKDVYANNVLTQQIDPLGNTTKYEYDANLDLTKVTDPRNNATTMTYDSNGNMLTRKAPAPLNYLETWTYNSFNDPTSYKDGQTAHNETDYGYDSSGNLTSVTGPDPDGGGPLVRPVTTYGRDPAGTGLLFSIKDPKGQTTGHTTSFSYDAQGNLSQTTSPLGEITTKCYDASGRLAGVVDPRGTQSCADPNPFKWLYTYNANDQLATQTDPLGHLTQLNYDPAGNLISRVDPNTHTTSYEYFPDNRLKKVTAPDPDGAGPLVAPVTQYTYDAVGNLQTRQDANTHTITYSYDNANRLASVLTANSETWTYGYDAASNPTTIVDANGNATPTPTTDGTTTYGYDELNRLKSINYSDTTPAVTYTYDANNNRIQQTDGSGSQTYSYDTLNSLTGVTRGSDTFTYTYDQAGNPKTTTYPDGTSVTYTFDDDERLASLASGGSTTSYAYYPNSSLHTTTLPSGNGYVETRNYDNAGRLTEVKNAKGASTLSDFVYTLDPVGNPLTVTRTGTTNETQTYSYDNMDRLTGVCFQAGTCPNGTDPFVRWTYDGVDNRLTQTKPGASTSYTYNAADQLTQAGTTNYTYDHNGNEKTSGSSTFNYDLANRLTSATVSGTTTTYTYDADGKRLQASTGSQASKKTNFLWDLSTALPQIALERDGNNALLREYLYGADRVAMNTGGKTYYYHYDPLGSVVNVTGSTGATEWTDSYEPYGPVHSETKNDTKAPTNLMKYAGEYLDPTGLYHLRARQYDPTTGRFTRLDPRTTPITSPDASQYTYVTDQPTVLIDPSGMAGEPSNHCGSWAEHIPLIGGAWCEGFQTLSPNLQAGIGTYLNVAPLVLAFPAAPEGAAAEEGSGIVAGDGTRISGFTRHGIDRVIGDGAKRAGVKPQALLDAVKNPTKITEGVDNLGRPYKIYTGSDARVVVNPETGQIISVNPLSGAGASG